MIPYTRRTKGPEHAHYLNLPGMFMALRRWDRSVVLRFIFPFAIQWRLEMEWFQIARNSRHPGAWFAVSVDWCRNVDGHYPSWKDREMWIS